MDRFLDDVERAVPALRRYARGLCGNADRADDLVQDCLERAIRKRSLFVPAGPVKAWLFRMLLNIYRNDLRYQHRRGEVVALEGLAPEPSTPPGQLARVALAEMARAIEALPLEQREALLLVVLEGLSYSEAASILDIPPGTLMSRLGRARASLRARTGGSGEVRLRTVK